MRIISGKFKSRKIDFPKNRLTRPMTDRTKETLFNIVGSFVFGKHALDLYAGSGSLGLEALSRGAISATFVDQAPWAKKPRSEETKKKMSAYAKNRPKKHCPHCGRDIVITAYRKYHGNNCKQRNSI